VNNFIGILSIVFSFAAKIFAANVAVMDIPSHCMNKSFKATIITPSDYAKSTKHYSVIYFLHGYSGNYSVWSRIADLTAYCDTYALIFICPDGGYNSWYMDSPEKENSKFETYIVKEVVSFVDSSYRTWRSGKGRALIGSSMGGHGALTLLAKHADCFLGAASLSGILDLSKFPHQWGLADVLGPYEKHPELWRNHSFIGLMERLEGKGAIIILDCGTSDFALSVNREAHEMLTRFAISHDYFERPGSHSPEYCRRNVEMHIRHFSKILMHASDSSGAVR